MLLTAVLLAVVFSVWAAILYFQLRHGGLTALVLLSPLPFVVAATLVQFSAIPYALFSYVLGIAIAQMIAARVARGICDGLAPRIAIFQAIGEGLKLAGPIVLGFGAWILVADLYPFDQQKTGAATILFAVLAGTPIAMLAVRWLPYPEQFIARANQARERRERVLDHFQFIAEARWTFSISGVALIFFALSALGMRALQVHESLLLPQRLAALAVIVLACAIALTRNWRLGLAFALTLSLLGAIGLWIFARGNDPVQQQILLTMSLLLATVAVPLASLATSVSAHIRAGDDAALALARGYREECASAVLSAAIFVVPWLIFGLRDAARLELAISIASLVAAPLIFPAFAGAMYAIFPRYRTVDEVFGKR